MRDDFLQKPSFLQSVEWKKLQNSVGRKTWEIDGVLVIQHRLPAGLSYLYCPRPIGLEEVFWKEIGKIVDQEQSIFLKIDIARKLRVPANYKYINIKSDSLQPQKTAIVDLRKSEEELLSQMHEKTRYNIKLAERRGVRTGITDNFATFWSLLEETAQREGFSTHEKGYYENLFIIASESFSNKLFFAEYRGKILAAAMVNFYKPSATATYLHGASTRECKEIMAPHLLHWQVIKEAKKRGFNYYDFWGIDEKKWPGLTRFKLGFGGEVIEYPPTIDIIYRPAWYKVYRLVKKLYKTYS